VEVVAVFEDAPVDQVWRQQSVWSQIANRMESSIGRVRTASLTLTIGSAILATVAGVVSGAGPAVGSALAVVAAVGVGVVPVLRPRWSGTVLRDWTRARSVSEALKSEVYLCLAGAGDYAGQDRDTQLVKATDAVLRQATDLLRHGTDIEPVRRDLPDVSDHMSYFRVRVDAQADGFYRPRARRLQVRLTWFRRVELGLSVVGVALGAMAARFPSSGFGAWIAVVTTITAAGGVHVAAARYEYQLVEYLRTAEELTRLRHAASRTTSVAELDDLVMQCERVISIQNEGWMAKLSTTHDVEPTN
jgi:hypothetical protein